ncbi:MAG: hypothetical protein V9E96_20145 [Chitinophagaceae bacterium]
MSPSGFAALIAATIASPDAALAQRTGSFSTASQSICSGTSARTPAIESVWLRKLTPNSPSSRFATAPTATRAAVSRALARSSTFRTSSNPYFSAPGRSAWPGRIRVTRSISVSTGSTAIFSVQFTQSRFWIQSASGEPSVNPCRTPDMISAWSDSIFIRPPRP